MTRWLSDFFRSATSSMSTRPPPHPGPVVVSLDQFIQVAPLCPKERAEATLAGLNEALVKIQATSVQVAACFIGQTGHESDGYKFLREVWGPTPIQAGYERNPGAAWPPTSIDQRNYKPWLLGNSDPGDGFNFRGWGPIQNTGHGTTLACSLYLFGDDRLVKAAYLLDDPAIGFAGAAWFWMAGARQRLSRGAKAYLGSRYNLATMTLNEPAAANDLEALTYAINGALTNHADRVRRIDLALHAITS